MTARATVRADSLTELASAITAPVTSDPYRKPLTLRCRVQLGRWRRTVRGTTSVVGPTSSAERHLRGFGWPGILQPHHPAGIDEPGQGGEQRYKQRDLEGARPGVGVD